MSGKDLTRDVRVYSDVEALGAAAAEWVAAVLTQSVRARGRASLVLSGGSTPRALHRQLASRFRDHVQWERVHIFWGDERYVPHDNPASNYRMAMETLLGALDVPAGNVHPMPTSFSDPADASRDYESTLATYFAGGPPVFDVVLLGIGEEGHTASVFPGSPAMTSRRTVMAVQVPANPSSRLTLTLPVIASARDVSVLVAGAAKAPALAEALSGTSSSPAAVIDRTASGPIWWVDRLAWGLQSTEHNLDPS